MKCVYKDINKEIFFLNLDLLNQRLIYSKLIE